ncbi:MAG: HU family DNA-binding protein [Clostridia bacterium]|nr:HU family DNA-binding protein [Clostridia bacterium]
MNKTELIAAVADKAGMSKKDAEKAVAAVLNTVEEALKADEKVSLVGFGTFEAKARPARKGHNPATGEEIDIPASKAPTFKAGKALKDALK